MANPNPSQATRFQPGNPGGPGARKGSRHVNTISRTLRAESLAEARAEVGCFRGSPREFLLAAMISPRTDWHVRLAAASALLKDSKDLEVDDKLSPTERKKRIHELIQKLAMGDAEPTEPPIIDGVVDNTDA
jgi:hypothetical protein